MELNAKRCYEATVREETPGEKIKTWGFPSGSVVKNLPAIDADRDNRVGESHRYFI